MVCVCVFFFLTCLIKPGFLPQVLASDLKPGTNPTPIGEVDWAARKVAVVMGNEERGITEEMRALCDGTYQIPMQASAAAIGSYIFFCLFHIHPWSRELNSSLSAPAVLPSSRGQLGLAAILPPSPTHQACAHTHTHTHTHKQGFAESFNLSVSTAVTLAFLSSLGGLKHGDLSQEDKDALVLRWLIKSVPQGAAILRREGLMVEGMQPARQTIMGFKLK